jgi:hypothetical protein
MFVFFNQLLNGMEWFGVFLVPLSKVKRTESLCPAWYGNILISTHGYQSMACTLYQKLWGPEVVPLEHTAVRNIINRYAEQNNGYQHLCFGLCRFFFAYTEYQAHSATYVLRSWDLFSSSHQISDLRSTTTKRRRWQQMKCTQGLQEIDRCWY